MQNSKSAFWFRRDLRLQDNIGLFHALKAEVPVVPVFIFDQEILEDLPKQDNRVCFIHQQILAIQKSLEAMGSSLVVRYGKVQDIWPKLVQEYSIQTVYTNHDYEPSAIQRDLVIQDLLTHHGCGFHTFRDQVIFEKDELLTGGGKPYSVFTPYSRKWKASLTQDRIHSVDTAAFSPYFFASPPLPIPSLASMGFQESEATFPPSSPNHEIIRHYEQKRNFPSLPGTSRLGIHLRFGTISIRQLVRIAIQLNETYLNELIWREFYMQILFNFPHVTEGPFRPQYAHIPWRNEEEEFEKWCHGQTGYPLVDAGMRELNATGFMHNRVRMVTASFLTKHLLIDWQWGEAYFAEKLLDFELASNNGGWQWAAGCGTDAAPYFRVFNPTSQMKKFDPDLRYVMKWVPEFGTPVYPKPIVEHKFARERCLRTYKEALDSIKA
ncbi:MAG: deoxyribodipyrimidine photo-lyase [Bacteroidota bacterium]